MHSRALILVLAASVLCACASTAPGSVRRQTDDPCLQYNQGLRITPNREWPALIEKIDSALQKNWWVSATAFDMSPDGARVRVGVKADSLFYDLREHGPEAPEYISYVKAKAEVEELFRDLAHQRTLAGDCFDGSLFGKMALRNLRLAELVFETMDAAVEKGTAEWAIGEEAYQGIAGALEALPEAVRSAQSASTQVRVVAVNRQSSPRSVVNSLVIEVTNLSPHRVAKTNLVNCWGYDHDSPEQGGCYDTGFSLKDNYGNSFALDEILGNEGPKTDIQPGASRRFTVIFEEQIPFVSKTVSLVVSRYAVGNEQPIELALPRSVFYPVAER